MAHVCTWRTAFAAALLLLTTICHAEFTTSPVDAVGEDGIPERVEFETPWYKGFFDLTEQGSAGSFIYKPLDHELRAENYYSNHNNLFRSWARAAEPDAGSDQTRVVNNNEIKTLTRSPATHKIIEQTDSKITLKFTWRNTEITSPAWFGKLRFDRFVTMYNDMPRVDVVEQVTNEDDAAHPVVFDTYNSVSLGRVLTACYMPDPDGKQIGEDIAEERGSRFIFAPNITGSWIGGVNENGLGAAFSFDWAQIDAMQINMWKTVGSSYQVAMRRHLIEPGANVKFDFSFLPVTEMGTLDGFADGLAAGILVGEKADQFNNVVLDSNPPKQPLPVKVDLYSDCARSVTIQATCTRREDDSEAFSQTVTLDLPACKRLRHTFDMQPPAKDGLYVLNVRVLEDKDEILNMNRPITIGRSRLLYTADQPTGKKLGVADSSYTFGAASVDEQFRTIDRDKITPHETWVKDHAAGRLPMLFLTPADSTLGHVRELTQRGGFDYDYLSVTKIQTPRDALNPQELRQFQQMLSTTDAKALCTLGINWQEGLKTRLTTSILDHVREDGLGVMLFVRQMKNQPLLAAALEQAKEISKEQLPLPLAAVRVPIVSRYQLGRGRIVIVQCNWTHYRDGGEAALGEWENIVAGKQSSQVTAMGWRGFEYSYIYLAQLLRWAAGEDSPIQITKVDEDSGSAVITINNTGAPITTTLTTTQRDRFWKPYHETKNQLTLPTGQSQHTIALRDSNMQALEIKLENEKAKTIAFASAGIAGTNKARIQIDPANAYSHPGQSRTVSVQLTSSKLETANLTATLVDRFGRVVYEQTLPVTFANRTAELTLNFADVQPINIYHELSIKVSVPDLVAQHSSFVFFLSDKIPFEDRFVVGMADGAERKALHIQGVVPEARKLGITMHTHNHHDPMLYWTGGFAGTSSMLRPTHDRYRTGEKAKLDAKKLIMYPPLVPDDETVAKVKAKWQASTKAALNRGAVQIHIDDERRMSGDFDFHPQTLARFRLWLADRYGNISALNQSWQTQFESFEQVMPSTYDQVDHERTYAPWLTFRMFIGEMLGEYYMRLPAEWAAEIGSASAGEFGIYEPSRSFPVDWSRYASAYRHTARYGDTQGVLQELFRSFAPNTSHGRWIGYGMRDVSPARRINPWVSLLHGGHFALYWAMVDSGYWNYGVIGSDQRPTKGYVALAADEFPDLTGGIDRLVIASEFLDDDITFAYSYPSWLVDRSALARNTKLITEQLGYQQRYIKLDQLVKDPNDKANGKLLFVQNVRCMSEAQANTIEQFASNGGHVIAIGVSGDLDLNGAPHETNPFDAVVGVETTAADRLMRNVTVKLDGRDATFDVLSSGVQATDAKTLLATQLNGETLPMITQRNIGSGRITWLNISFHRHQKVRYGGFNNEAITTEAGPRSQRDSHCQLLDKLIRDASIVPRMQLTTQAGEPIHDGEAFAYASPTGRSTLLARYISASPEGKVMYRLAQKGHVYDLRTHTYLGHTDAFELAVPAGRVNVFGVLPGKVANVLATVGKRALLPGERVAVQFQVALEDAAADLHAIRVSLIGPGNNPITAHDTVLLARNGKAEWSFPLALNAALGQYTVKAMDIASGKTGSAVFVVSPRAN